MSNHPISDECIAENWPEMNNPDGREEIRRQFDALMAQVRIRATYPFPRHPETMAPVIIEKARELPERLEILKAALAGLPPHWRQWQWSADEKPAFGDRFVRSNINGDNGHGFGRQWIACVNHVSKQYVGTLADLIAAANPDTLTMMVARIEELEAHTPAPETHMDGWQDISTAHRDGSEILVWNGRRRHVAHFDKIEGEWVSSFKTTTKRLIVAPAPTLWSPLPDEPSTTEGQADASA